MTCHTKALTIRCRNVGKKMKDFEAGKSLRSVIVDTIDEAGNVTVLIRTNDKAS